MKQHNNITTCPNTKHSNLPSCFLKPYLWPGLFPPRFLLLPPDFLDAGLLVRTAGVWQDTRKPVETHKHEDSSRWTASGLRSLNQKTWSNQSESFEVRNGISALDCYKIELFLYIFCIRLQTGQILCCDDHLRANDSEKPALWNKKDVTPMCTNRFNHSGHYGTKGFPLFFCFLSMEETWRALWLKMSIKQTNKYIK